MGKKYIIELLDECNSKFKGIMVFGLTQEKQISVELIPEESMTPYTAPDLEQVRKEAHEEGYAEGSKEDYDEAYLKGHNQGLADAWEAARKIWEYDTTTLREIFGEGIMRMDWFMKFTASEAIAKIKEYEDSKQEIKVGDEVIMASGKAVVMGVGPVHFEYVYADGSHGFDKVKNIKKTGRHFPEIAEVLRKMREGQEQ